MPHLEGLSYGADVRRLKGDLIGVSKLMWSIDRQGEYPGWGAQHYTAEVYSEETTL